MRSRFILAVLASFAVRRASAAPTIATSATARVLQDSNLYLQNSAPLVAGQVRPGVPADEAAVALDVSAAVQATWKAPTASVDLGYAPELVRYAAHATEDHTDHVLTVNAAGSAAGWTADLKTRATFVDGAKDAPIYNALGATPAIGGEPVRARRAQVIARASGKLSRPLGHGFVRGVFSAFDQDFHTIERSAIGYCNYADRGETSVGVEAGQPLWGSVSLVGGTRVGFQRQANVLGVPLNYSNTFTRWLGGVEGTPTKSLKLSILVGPDIRHYGRSVRSGFKREQQTGYGEASATWTPTKTDALTLSGRRYLWLSSAGRGTYADTVIDLVWKRKLAAGWSTSAGANYHEGDTSHFNVWSPRRDRVYTVTAGVSRALTSKLRVDVDVMHDWGISMVANTPGREYRRWIVGASVTRRW